MKFKIKASELRKLNEGSLKDRLNEEKKKLMLLKSQIAAGATPESTSAVRETKKNIARILTILTDKKNKAPEATKGSLKPKEETKNK